MQVSISIIQEQSNEKKHIVEGVQMKNCYGLVGKYSCID